MSGFRDNLLAVLAGGLPALLDDPTAGGQTSPVSPPDGSAVNPQRVEEVAPTGTIRDKEPFSLIDLTQNQILISTAAIIGAIALVMVVRR